MRNYYRTLKLSNADETPLEDQINDSAAAEPELADKARDILLNPERKAEYDKLHLQYLAIAAACQSFGEGQMLDTHEWQRRLVEFEPQ